MATEVPDAYSVANISHLNLQSHLRHSCNRNSKLLKKAPLLTEVILKQRGKSSDQPRAESTPSEFPAIRPGIAADLKFGGCGSYPNLPWVSTTGPGPNGRTISGVTYRYSPTQIRIVCACHGSHMSPEEFVRHAGEENSNPDAAGAGLASIPSSNTAASAQS
ncbi:UNVERIFIED_CONTAM: Ninja-family protein [Sesamum calycinum]|uniref:Ninja-family protein n=1 Tax=Sesamum calycinum TaxID=2727403 RepID=A0AAW2N3L0_9LAMI